MKKALIIIFVTLLTAYLVITMFFTFHKRPKSVCKKVDIMITDSLEKHFLSEDGIVSYLRNAKLYPLNKANTEINTYEIEQKLLKNELIGKATVYSTPLGGIKIEIEQKMPILRVFGADGNYYIDQSGKVMPVAPGHAINVPVASGNIEKSFAMSELHKFAVYLQKNDFWNNQIEQIFIHPNKEVELVPRIGEHRIILGSLDDFEGKLGNLRLFYEQVIPKMGWEKYSVVSVKYRNQIVCTKKEQNK